MDLKAFDGKLLYRDIGQFQLPDVIPYSADGKSAEAPTRLMSDIAAIVSPGCLIEAHDGFTARNGFTNYRLGIVVVNDETHALAVTKRGQDVTLELWPFTSKPSLVLWAGHPSGQACLYSAQRYLLSRAYPGLGAWAPYGFMTKHGYLLIGQSGETERGLLICNSRGITESAVNFAKGRLFSIIHSRDIFPSSAGRAVATAISGFDGATILRVTPSRSSAEAISASAASWLPNLHALYKPAR